jgi:hypothetical protein
MVSSQISHFREIDRAVLWTLRLHIYRGKYVFLRLAASLLVQSKTCRKDSSGRSQANQ